MPSNIDDSVIEGTNVDSNPEFGPIVSPRKKTIVNPLDPETTVIEAPLSDGSMGFPDDTAKIPEKNLKTSLEGITGAHGTPVKRSVSIEELDNGYIVNLDVYPGTFHKRYVFGSLQKVLKAIGLFYRIALVKDKK